MEKAKNTKTTIIVISVLVVLTAGMLAAYFTLRPRGIDGEKTITVAIIAHEQNTKTIRIDTTAAYLRQALDENNLVQGDESQFGLFIKTVSDITADEAKQEWWCITKDGEMLMTGADDTPIEDGDVFEITLTIGYD